MYLSSSESRSLFIETAALLPLLMLPSLLSIISSNDGGSESYIIGDSAAAAGLLNDGFDAQLRGGPSSRAHGAVLLLPDYDFLTERSELVLRKLNSMALGKTSKSGLSLEQLRAALEELREYGPAFELQAKQALPSIHLLSDLLGAMELSNALPVDSSSSGASANRNQSQAERYINRLEIQYKFLRPLYLTRRREFLYNSINNNADNQDDDYQGAEDSSKVKTIKTSAAIRALLTLKDHKPLTNKLLAEALVEYIECLQKFNKLDGETNTLAIKQPEQLGMILSYLNSVEVRLLGLHVFSKLHLLSGQEELDQLKKTYLRELFKSGLIVEDGEIRIVGGLVEPANNCEPCAN